MKISGIEVYGLRTARRMVGEASIEVKGEKDAYAKGFRAALRYLDFVIKGTLEANAEWNKYEMGGKGVSEQDIVDRLQNNHRDLHGDDYTIAMFADRKEAAALIISLRGEIKRLREIIRQNCNGDVVGLSIPYKSAFELTAKSLELSNKALRECQLLLCVQQEWGDCAKDLEEGERCACGFEDGPFGNAVPKNREANQLRDRVAELEKALNPFAAIADRAEEMGFKADNSVLYVTLGPCLRARAVLNIGSQG